MGEDNKEFKDQLDALAKDIKAGFQAVDKKVDGVAIATKTLEEKVSTIKVDKQEEDDELDVLDGPEEISKKVDRKVDEKLAQFQTQIQRDNDFKQACERFDQEAFRKFPDLTDQTSEFSRLVRERLNDPQRTVPIGRDKLGKPILSPDAILNAANSIAVDNPKFLQMQRFEELEGGGNFQRKIKGKEMSEITKEIAGFYAGSHKINMDRLKERVKNARVYTKEQQ